MPVNFYGVIADNEVNFSSFNLYAMLERNVIRFEYLDKDSFCFCRSAFVNVSHFLGSYAWRLKQ